MSSSRIYYNHYLILIVVAGFILSIPVAIFVNQIDTSTFFGLFVPALLGILGSYAIYLERQRDQRSALREALKSEIEGMYLLQSWPRDPPSIPFVDVITMNVFESSSNNLGLLGQDEREAIVGFYTRAKALREAFKYHGEMEIRYDTAVLAIDESELDRQKGIMVLIDRLAIRRHYVLHLLDTYIKGDYQKDISHGSILSGSHPIMKRNPEILVRYGFLKECENTNRKFIVTQKGQRLFAGKFDFSEFEPKEYQLGGLDEFFQHRLPRKIQSVAKRIIQLVIQKLKKQMGFNR